MSATEVQKDELRDKIGKLVRDQFGGDYRKAFDHYDGDVKDGKISHHELTRLLGDAGVGNWLTRSTWASGIIAELDTDKDGSISQAEFDGVLGE
jgi:Ca2+-binding EF-hand superfamily protein